MSYYENAIKYLDVNQMCGMGGVEQRVY